MGLDGKTGEGKTAKKTKGKSAKKNGAWGPVAPPPGSESGPRRDPTTRTTGVRRRGGERSTKANSRWALRSGTDTVSAPERRVGRL